MACLVGLLRLVDQAEVKEAVPSMPSEMLRHRLAADHILVSPNSTIIRAFMDDVRSTLLSNSAARSADLELLFYADDGAMLDAYMDNDFGGSGVVGVAFDDAHVRFPSYTLRFDGHVSSVLQTSTVPADKLVKAQSNKMRIEGVKRILRDFYVLHRCEMPADKRSLRHVSFVRLRCLRTRLSPARH